MAPASQAVVQRKLGRASTRGAEAVARAAGTAFTWDSEKRHRVPAVSHTPHLCDEVAALTVHAEVFGWVAQTPQLGYSADSSVRPAFPEAGGWAVSPADIGGAGRPTGSRRPLPPHSSSLPQLLGPAPR